MEFLFPLSIIVFLKIFLLFRLIYMATRYTLSKDIRLSQFRLYKGDFPDDLLSARQHYRNMFEVPVLFYLLCLLHIILNNYSQLDIILIWGFVIFRSIHFLIRLRNQKSINIIPRTLIFLISLIFLTLGWMNIFLTQLNK